MIEERWTKSKISDIAKHLAIQESRNKDALVCRCTFHFGTSFRPATKDEIIKNTCKKAFTTPYRERGKVPAEAYHMGKWLGYTVEFCSDGQWFNIDQWHRSASGKLKHRYLHTAPERDMHFGHENVIRFDDRPFADTEQMDEVLIQNWNERVTADDTVNVLGDAFWKNEENSIRIMQRLQGHKHLIQGNHDRVKGKLRPYWESIEQYAEVNDENRLAILSHYPILFYKNQHYGAVMLYGHVHNTREWSLVEKWKNEQWRMGIPSRLINVGCMMDYMNYMPRTLDELLEANPQPTIERIRKDGTNAGENSNGEL